MFKDQNIQNKESRKEITTIEAIKDIFTLAKNNPKAKLNNSETGYTSPDQDYQVIYIKPTDYYNISENPVNPITKTAIFSLGLHDKHLTLIVHPWQLQSYQEQLKDIEDPTTSYDTDNFGRIVFKDKKYPELGPKLQKFIDIKLEEIKEAFVNK